MKMITNLFTKFILLVCISLFALFAFGKTAISFSRDGSDHVEKISLKELSGALSVILSTTLNPPSSSQFINNYVRYRIIVNEGYLNKDLVQSAQISKMIIDPTLKESFRQLLYRHVSFKALESPLKRLERQSSKLTDKQLMSFYKRNPYYQFQYIIVKSPSEVNRSQQKNLEDRADDIYNKVKKSSKSFSESVRIYSDSPDIGHGIAYHPEKAIHSSLLKVLNSLKKDQVSRPVQTAIGLFIIKMIEKIPFSKVNKEALKQQHLSINKAQALDKYLNRVKSRYDIKMNQKLLRSL